MLDLIPFGLIDPLVVSIVAANIQSVVGLLSDILPNRPKPEDAYMAVRNQYDAAKMIATLAGETDGAPLKLGVTQYDLGIPILTYVYGESQMGGKAAVISLNRLFDIDRQVTYERAAKIGIHEVGHLLGLEHCWQTNCLMRFSKQLDQLDSLPIQLCSACEYEIGRRVGRLLNNS